MLVLYKFVLSSWYINNIKPWINYISQGLFYIFHVWFQALVMFLFPICPFPFTSPFSILPKKKSFYLWTMKIYIST